LITGLGDVDKKIKIKIDPIEDLKIARKIASQNGFVDLEAEVLNSMGLILRLDKSKSDEAEKVLLDAIQLNIYIGNDRRCFAQLRNLGLIYGQKEDRKRAYECYTSAETYLAKLNNVKGDFLEARFRQGESLVRLGENEKAVKILEDLLNQRKELNDWHNSARTIELLIEATWNKNAVLLIREIVELYEDVFNDEEKLDKMKKLKIRATNAVGILNTAKEKLKSVEDDFIKDDERNELNGRIEALLDKDLLKV